MKVMTRFGLIVVGIATVAGSAWAQPFAVPPGRWWERPRMATELDLSVEQRKTLDDVALKHAKAMVDLKGEVEKSELDLGMAAAAEPFDARSVREAFAVLQQRRMRLEQERFEMLLRVREVLTTEQWTKLTALAKTMLRREAREGGAEDAPAQRRPPRPRRF